jgi:hypothetical protein
MKLYAIFGRCQKAIITTYCHPPYEGFIGLNPFLVRNTPPLATAPEFGHQCHQRPSTPSACHYGRQPPTSLAANRAPQSRPVYAEWGREGPQWREWKNKPFFARADSRASAQLDPRPQQAGGLEASFQTQNAPELLESF